MIALERFAGKYIDFPNTEPRRRRQMARKITITSLRHGNATLPHGMPTDAPNSARRLSWKGRMQALARREQLGNPEFDLILVSQEIRTAETAMVVAGEGTNSAPVVMLYELFTPHTGLIHDSLERLYGALVHSPLRAYYRAENAQDVLNMKNFGEDGWDAIEDQIDLFSDDINIRNVLVVGHGMYGVAMVHAKSPRMAEVLMDIPQGECEGFTVTLINEESESGDSWPVESIVPLPPLASLPSSTPSPSPAPAPSPVPAT